MNLLAIIDDYTFGDSYLEVASKCSSKASIIWYRIKNRDASEIFKRALALRNLLKTSALVLSSRADIALACGFNGVHLNADCIPPRVIKNLYPNLLVGFSAHSGGECHDASCDYFTLSPIFHTPKEYEIKPLGLINAPAKNVYALGGINSTNFKSLENLGYVGIAGIGICKDNLETLEL